MMQMIFLSRLGQQLCVPKQERLTALFTGSGTDCVSACNGKWWADAKIRVLENASLHAILSCKEWRTHLHSGKGSGQVPLLLCFAWRPVLRSGASVDFSLRPSVKNWYLILLSGPSLWISNTCSQSKEGSPPHPSAPPPPGTSVCIFISHLDDHTERSLPCLSWLCQSLFCIFRSLWISPLWTWPWVQSSIYLFHCLINVSFSDHSLMRKGPTPLVGSIQSLVPRMVPDS